jgi:hypothetical protein
MAQYPVDDETGVYDAINYLLSGPAGLGQNYDGFSSYVPANFQANYLNRQPYTFPPDTTLQTSWYLTRAISNIVPSSPTPSETITVTFTTPYTNVPFQFGDVLGIFGVTESGTGASYNGTYLVYSCTTTTVTLSTLDQTTQTYKTYGSGGTLIRNFTNQIRSTDCGAVATITGPSDRVFISSQLTLYYEWLATDPLSEWDIVVRIDRYVARPTNVQIAGQTAAAGDEVKFVYDFQETIFEKIYHESVTSRGGGTSGTDTLDTIFTTVIDAELPAGYYGYNLNIGFITQPTDTVYVLGTGELLDNAFTGSGVINQSVASGTSYAGVALTGGSGAGAIATITLYPDGVITQYSVGDHATNGSANCDVNITTAGSGYKINDILTVPGTSLGGATPTNDLTLKVTSVQYPGDAHPGFMVGEQRSLVAQVIKQ